MQMYHKCLGCPPPRDLIPTKQYAGLGACHGLVSGLEPSTCCVRPPKYPRVRRLSRPHHSLRWQRRSPRQLAASDTDAMGIAIAFPRCALRWQGGPAVPPRLGWTGLGCGVQRKVVAGVHPLTPSGRCLGKDCCFNQTAVADARPLTPSGRCLGKDWL